MEHGITEDEAAKQSDLEHRIKSPIIWGRHNLIGLRFEDLQDKRIDEAIKLLKEHYLTEDVLYRTIKITDEPDSVSEFLQNAKTWMKDKASICAIKESTNAIIGVLIMRVQERSAFSRTFSLNKISRNPKYAEVMAFCNLIEKPVNIHTKFNAKIYVKIYLMALIPRYRHRGIGADLLKYALDYARLSKVPVVASIFTTGKAQAIATKLGFEKLNEMYYVQYQKSDTILFYNAGEGNHGAALMAVRVLPEEEAQDQTSS